MAIKLLDIVFQKPVSSEEITRKIASMSPQFDGIAKSYPEQQGQLANRVLETARASVSDAARRAVFESGALEAGANDDLKGNLDSAFWVRQMGIRNGTIDGLNPSHDLQWLITDKPPGLG